jgi:hypothetical protein
VWVSDRLDPVAYPLAAIYAAIHRYVLWCHLSNQRRTGVTEGGTAHFFVVRLHHHRPKPADTGQVVSASSRVKLLLLSSRQIRVSWGEDRENQEKP